MRQERLKIEWRAPIAASETIHRCDACACRYSFAEMLCGEIPGSGGAAAWVCSDECADDYETGAVLNGWEQSADGSLVPRRPRR